MALVRPETAGAQRADGLRGPMSRDNHSGDDHEQPRHYREDKNDVHAFNHCFTRGAADFFVLLREVFGRVPDHFKRYGSGSVLGAFITVSKIAAIA